MFTDKEEFYADRILWKANQHKLIPNLMSEFYCFDLPKRESIEAEISFRGTPILVLYESMVLWTVLTSQEIVSKDGSSLNRIYLDDINKDVRIESVELDQNVKENVEFLNLGSAHVRVWGGKGKTFFGLMGILRMFPLGSR